MEVNRIFAKMNADSCADGESGFGDLLECFWTQLKGVVHISDGGKCIFKSTGGKRAPSYQL